MKLKVFTIALVLALAPSLAAAQWQYTKPGVDSTFVHGIAERVMPEFTGGGVGGGSAPPASSQPTTMEDLLQRWAGLIIEFPQLGMRYVVQNWGVEVHVAQLHGNMTVICVMYPSSPVCTAGDGGENRLTSTGITHRGFFCPPGWSGSYRAEGEFLWMDYIGDGGNPAGGGSLLFTTMKRTVVLKNCYEEGGG